MAIAAPLLLLSFVAGYYYVTFGRLIDQQLTAEDDELTPTMKLRRKFVNEKYKALIDGMYASA